eukprot:CAMPEP_0174330018 /NCGR_PEP_ID=MMETSP0810-20121108/16341_1 /TAXON_ID=73025 ORGANISM="Eutreptiella gymnastica-like, Strain CCMP1594" /NCGR_SAMPLE_ID=MMETSP0810 /ASSEMBLY_ACC=CAM_ASM_000659 /LENGTH=96 /DNA_ID=CAMNT_0015444933 /DNA_START=231 /DNA_END=521 /DNA_ORIENTATION=-
MASFPAEVGVNPSCSTSEALPVKWIRRFTMTDTASGHWAQGILQWPVQGHGLYSRGPMGWSSHCERHGHWYVLVRKLERKGSGATRPSCLSPHAIE